MSMLRFALLRARRAMAPAALKAKVARCPAWSLGRHRAIVMSPPCACTARRQKVKPRPRPCGPAALPRCLARMARRSSRAIPVGHPGLDPPPGVRPDRRDEPRERECRALVRVAQGVVDAILEYSAQEVSIGDDVFDRYSRFNVTRAASARIVKTSMISALRGSIATGERRHSSLLLISGRFQHAVCASGSETARPRLERGVKRHLLAPRGQGLSAPPPRRQQR